MNDQKPNIEIFVRHCNFSKISYQKKRIDLFSKQNCYNNLINTTKNENVNITFLIDTHFGELQDHFLSRENQNIIEMKKGTEALSFLELISFVKNKNIHPDTIIYFLEDDYIHRENWINILLEGFSIEGVDYVTLYDHRDKYFLKNYDYYKSKIFCTKSSHWRDIPSTTNTFAMRYATFLKDYDVHKKFSTNIDVSDDHKKFCKLTSNGSTIICPIPGYSTHGELEFVSPVVNWEKVISKTIN
jgi:hypothetical protein